MDYVRARTIRAHLYNRAHLPIRAFRISLSKGILGEINNNCENSEALSLRTGSQVPAKPLEGFQ